MSLEATNWVWSLENITPTRKLVMLCIANFADQNHESWPSNSYIAKKVGLKDPKGVQKIIRELESLGYIKRTPRFKEDKHGKRAQTSNIFTLLIPLGLGSTTPHRPGDPLPTDAQPPNTKDDTKDKTKELFEEFWKLYPRKGNKHTASLKYKIALKDLSHDELIKRVKFFANVVEVQKTELKFVPLCSTWLNQKRYLDGTLETITEVKKSLNSIAG